MLCPVLVRDKRRARAIEVDVASADHQRFCKICVGKLIAHLEEQRDAAPPLWAPNNVALLNQDDSSDSDVVRDRSAPGADPTFLEELARSRRGRALSASTPEAEWYSGNVLAARQSNHGPSPGSSTDAPPPPWNDPNIAPDVRAWWQRQRARAQEASRASRIADPEISDGPGNAIPVPLRCNHPSSWDVTRAHQEGVLDRAELEARNPQPTKENCWTCDKADCISLMCLGDGYFCSVECRDEWHDLNPEANHGARAVYVYYNAPSPPPYPPEVQNNASSSSTSRIQVRQIDVQRQMRLTYGGGC